VNPEHLVVNDSLNDVEHAPAEQYQAEVKTPGRGQSTVSPGSEQGDGAGQHADPREDMEEAVKHDVGLEPGDRAHRKGAEVGHHVVPLQQLVQHDTVHEAAETDPEEKPGRLGGRPTREPWSRIGRSHDGALPATYVGKRRYDSRRGRWLTGLGRRLWMTEAVTGHGQPGHHDGLRVMTWNVWGRFGAWHQREPAILHTLTSQDAPDTIALLVEIEHPAGRLHFATTSLDWEQDHGSHRLAQARALGR
jgi:hypothetical protein